MEKKLRKTESDLEMNKMVLRLLDRMGLLDLSMSSPLTSKTNNYYLNNEPINEATYNLIKKVKNNLFK